MLPLQTLTQVITPVLHPVLSGVQHDKPRIMKGFLKITKLLALIGFPLSVFLAFSGREIVLIVFGNQWENSVPVFSILAWSVGLQIVLSSTGSIFQAAGRTDLLFVSGSLSAVLMVGGIVIGLTIGNTETVATALLLAFIVNFIQGTMMLVMGALRGSYREFIVALSAPLMSAVAVFGALLVASRLLESVDYTLFVSLGIKAVAAGIAFGLALWVTGQVSFIRELTAVG